jgi:hypothetical protein
MTHREKMKFVMEEAHAWANLHKHEFNSYRGALSRAMRLTWSVIQGKPLPGTEEMVHRYNQYTKLQVAC